MLTLAEPEPPKKPRKSLLDRMVDCREAEIRKQPCPEDKKGK